MVSAARTSRISLYPFNHPLSTRDASELNSNSDYLKELSYEVEQLSKSVYNNITKLNHEKKVKESVDSKSGRVFSLDTPGGIRETFLLNLLLITVRIHNKLRFLSLPLEY